jgi:hypothetical protein
VSANDRAACIDREAISDAVYGSGLAGRLLGGCLHPGGEELTRRLADLVGIGPGDRVLDVASGAGATARLLAAERGVHVLGVDRSPALVASAHRGADELGVGGRVAFEVGDAERLAVPEGSFDVVVCECALCLFGDPAAAVDGFRRALVPGGRLGIAAVTLDRGRLPAELDTPIGHVACLAGALPSDDYAGLLTAAGFTNIQTEPHHEAALATVDRLAEGIAAAAGLVGSAFDVGRALRLLALARVAILEGHLGYALIAARASHRGTA